MQHVKNEAQLLDGDDEGLEDVLQHDVVVDDVEQQEARSCWILATVLWKP